MAMLSKVDPRVQYVTLLDELRQKLDRGFDDLRTVANPRLQVRVRPTLKPRPAQYSANASSG